MLDVSNTASFLTPPIILHSAALRSSCLPLNTSSATPSVHCADFQAGPGSPACESVRTGLGRLEYWLSLLVFDRVTRQISP